MEKRYEQLPIGIEEDPEISTMFFVKSPSPLDRNRQNQSQDSTPHSNSLQTPPLFFHKTDPFLKRGGCYPSKLDE
jgi:hypothetical protein